MQDRTKKIKEQLLEIGPFHPGKITQQYMRCGKKNCKCQDPNNTQKHGPYHVLSYSVGKKNSTVFLKSEDLEKAEAWIQSYEKFMTLAKELTDAYISLAKQNRWNHP
jgi:hypothetical protein